MVLWVCVDVCVLPCSSALYTEAVFAYICVWMYVIDLTRCWHTEQTDGSIVLHITIRSHCYHNTSSLMLSTSDGRLVTFHFCIEHTIPQYICTHTVLYWWYNTSVYAHILSCTGRTIPSYAHILGSYANTVTLDQLKYILCCQILNQMLEEVVSFLLIFFISVSSISTWKHSSSII